MDWLPNGRHTYVLQATYILVLRLARERHEQPYKLAM